MKLLENNKELIIFYFCVLVFVGFWMVKIDKENDIMMSQKNLRIVESK